MRLNYILFGLAAALVLASAVVSAAADPNHPDCEDGQPAAGNEDFVPLSAGPVFVCEGEHYDGGDWVDSGDGAGTTDTDASDGTVAVSDGSQTSDSDQAANAPTVTQPVIARASVNAAEGDAYVHVGIFSVGEIILAADDDADKTTVAWWGHDHTDQATGTNVIAEAISAADITRGDSGEGDCSYEDYESTRSFPGGCTRDNTAITAEVSK